MGTRGDSTTVGVCVWVVAALAISGLVLRLPWSALAPMLAGVPAAAPAVNWLVANEAVVVAAQRTVEYALVWVLVGLGLPALYPRGARALTSTLRFRVSVATVTTACVVLFTTPSMSGLRVPLVLVLVLAAFCLSVATTSLVRGWQFETPYVSPVYAVLVSFVPTSRLSEFASLYRMGADDPLAKGTFQLLFGLSTAGVVLIVGTLAAFPILAAPLAELLVLFGLSIHLGRRVVTVVPTSRQRRLRTYRRKLRRTVWLARRVLTARRGLPSMLLVTAGLLVAGSVVVLAVALGASALKRTPPNAPLSFAPAGVLAEWLVVIALFTHVATVGRFWVRVARALPTLLGVDDRQSRTASLTRDGDQFRLDHPVWTQLPPAAALVAALFVLYPGVLPGANRLPAIGVLVALTALSYATNWLDAPQATVGRTAPPRIPNTAVVPVAFAVQWLGVSAALIVFPGTSVVSVTSTAVLVLFGSFGAYLSSDIRSVLDRYDASGVVLLSLFVVLGLYMLLV